MNKYTMDKNMAAAIQCGLCDISGDILQQTYITISIDFLQKVMDYCKEFGEDDTDCKNNLNLAETAHAILEQISGNLSNTTADLELYLKRISRLHQELESKKHNISY